MMMDYVDHIVMLMARHNANGYYHKDRSALIGFHHCGGIAWYRRNGDNSPVKVDRGSPEQEFSRLNYARFNRLQRGV